MELKLRKFDMRMIKDDCVVVLLGKRNTGKSYILRDMLTYHTDIPLGVVISPDGGGQRLLWRVRAQHLRAARV